MRLTCSLHLLLLVWVSLILSLISNGLDSSINIKGRLKVFWGYAPWPLNMLHGDSGVAFTLFQRKTINKEDKLK